MKTACVFSGQGAQKPGMGADLYASFDSAKTLFERANALLGFRISDVMFEGSAEALRQTHITQPALFLHSVIGFLMQKDLTPTAVAGHSLGEFSALVAAGVLDFETGLSLVRVRANAMQEACELRPSTMAAVLGLEAKVVETLCADAKEDEVYVANYNTPTQIVISGTKTGIEKVTKPLLAAGAKRVLPLAVGGAFHSPLMEPARKKLEMALNKLSFRRPQCPIYQNVDALPSQEPEEIKAKLARQLTLPVRWMHSIERMYADGMNEFVECGTGQVLQGLIKKIQPKAATRALNTLSVE